MIRVKATGLLSYPWFFKDYLINDRKAGVASGFLLDFVFCKVVLFLEVYYEIKLDNCPYEPYR